MTSGKSFVRLDGLDSVPQALRGGIVAIGNFDGCHRGHQSVLGRALEMARAGGVPTLVLTFEPHPRDVFAPKPFLYRLTDADAKAELVRALGFDGIAVMPFSRMLAGVEASAFVADYLVGALGASGVVVGGDFHFGKGRAGTPDFLRGEGARLGFKVHVAEMLEAEGEPVSSSRVRAALAAGDIATANGLLGYRHFFSGTVTAGDKRGRVLGFPTANIATAPNTGLAQGVYAVRVRLDGRVLDGVSAYGKPMFDNGTPPFETFILDFEGDLYGHTLTVALVDHLREQARFPDLDALVAQMERDVAAARAVLARARPLSALDAALGFVGGTEQQASRS